MSSLQERGNSSHVRRWSYVGLVGSSIVVVDQRTGEIFQSYPINSQISESRLKVRKLTGVPEEIQGVLHIEQLPLATYWLTAQGRVWLHKRIGKEYQWFPINTGDERIRALWQTQGENSFVFTLSESNKLQSWSTLCDSLEEIQPQSVNYWANTPIDRFVLGDNLSCCLTKNNELYVWGAWAHGYLNLETAQRIKSVISSEEGIAIVSSPEFQESLNIPLRLETIGKVLDVHAQGNLLVALVDTSPRSLVVWKFHTGTTKLLWTVPEPGKSPLIEPEVIQLGSECLNSDRIILKQYHCWIRDDLGRMVCVVLPIDSNHAVVQSRFANLLDKLPFDTPGCLTQMVAEYKEKLVRLHSVDDAPVTFPYLEYQMHQWYYPLVLGSDEQGRVILYRDMDITGIPVLIDVTVIE